jgi:S-layer homology domain
MTDMPSPETPRPETESSRRRRELGFDDFIGILVAFATIGGILWWVLGKSDTGFKGFPSLTGSVTEEPSRGAIASPTPTAQVSPTQPILTPTTPAVVTPKAEVPKAIAPRTEETIEPESRVTSAIPYTVTPPPPPRRNAFPAQRGEIFIPIGPDQKTAAIKRDEFTDIPENFWAFPFINFLQKRGVVTGFPDRKFNPNKPITRAEFALFLPAVFEKGNIITSQNYKDVPADFWANSAIKKATTTGFMKGFPGGNFQPGKPIPRVQAIVALANGLGLKPKADPAQTLQIYKDAAQIPNYAKSAVAAATEAGLIVNHPDPKLLNPNKMATRAEASALIYQALTLEGRAPKVNSNFIVQPQ